MKAWFAAALCVGVLAAPLWAAPLIEPLVGADVVFLGETHDNPGHHARQAEIVAALHPQAVIFEMLTADQAALVTGDLRRDPKALAEALEWAQSGWPSFDLYYPIIAAAPQAWIGGAAVPRSAARSAMSGGIVDSFGAQEAAEFGLDRPLPEDQQSEREAGQMQAHCDALPVDLLPMMVDIQRLRDAVLARAAAHAFDAHGGPVVVIAGNGHARLDWGAPSYLRVARPALALAALGQTEGGAILGPFDTLADSPPVARDDPCAAFDKDS